MWSQNTWLYCTYSVEILNKGRINIPGGMGQDGVKFYTSQNGVQLIVYFWNFLCNIFEQ